MWKYAASKSGKWVVSTPLYAGEKYVKAHVQQGTGGEVSGSPDVATCSEHMSAGACGASWPDWACMACRSVGLQYESLEVWRTSA